MARRRAWPRRAARATAAVLAVAALASCGSNQGKLEEFEARALAAIEAASTAGGTGSTATPIESRYRQRCEEGYTLKFKGRYRTSWSFEVSASPPTTLGEVVTAIGSRWQQQGWDVQPEKASDGTTRELSADDEGFLLAARDYGDSLRVTSLTPCASPQKPR